MKLDNKIKKRIYWGLIGLIIIIIISSIVFMFFNNQKDLIPEVFDSCDSFKTDEKTVCMNNVALDLAFSKKNISYCDYLDDNLLKIMDCKRDFVFENSILNENISICYLANDDEVLSKCITNYYSLFSFSRDDISFCDYMENVEQKNTCKNNYFFKNELIRDISNFDCNKFIGDSMIVSCEQYVNMSNSESNEIDCNSLSDIRFIRYCSNPILFNK